MLYADGTIILGACQGKGGDFASEESMVFCCILVGLWLFVAYQLLLLVDISSDHDMGILYM